MSEIEIPPTDANEAYWDFTASIGVQSDRLRTLEERLVTDFRAADGGYASLGALPQPQQAVVSDQILTASQGVIRNLAEARLHEQDINSLLSDGVPFAEVTPDAQEHSTRIDLSFVGFFRGLGSALDCLAATTIGVLRLPFSTRRASFPALWKRQLTEDVAGRHPAWVELRQLISRHADEPAGWLQWTLEMRHALMHRPRQMNMMLPRAVPELRIWLPASVARKIMIQRLRFDPHFRRAPWLPDMQHLADQYTGALPNTVLGEKATQTARGCYEAVNRLTEDLAAFALEKWEDDDVAAIAPPADSWALEAPLDVAFEGFVPQALRDDLAAGLISPNDEQRVRLAADLQGAARVG